MTTPHLDPVARVAMLGPLGPAQLACFRSWRHAGAGVLWLDTEEHPLPSLMRGVVDDYHHIGPVGGLEPNQLARVRDALLAARASHLTCLGEQLAIQLWRQRAALPPNVTLLMNPAEVMIRLESKAEQVELGRSAGFSVLPTELIDASNYWNLADTLTYPLALRPDRASLDGSFKAAFVDTADELRSFMAIHSDGERVVVAQRFINGASIVIHGSRSEQGQHGELHAFLGRFKHGGVTVALEPYPLDSALAQACRRFADGLGLRGVFHFDLLLDDATGQSWFLEVNARFGGTTAKVCAAGYDEPRAFLTACGLLDSSVRPQSRPRHSVVNRMAALKALTHALRGTRTRIDYPIGSWIPLLKIAARSLISFRDEVLSLRRPVMAMVFLSQYLPKKR